MMGYLKSGMIGGIIVYLWMAFSWMVLPWHMTTLHSFNNEKAVSKVLMSNASQSGIYMMPMQSTQQNQASSTAAPMPLVFASVHLEGMPASMTMPIVISVIAQIVAAIFIAWMLSKTTGLGYFGRVAFVLVFAIAASIVAYVPYWNWFAFDERYILVTCADLLIAWFLAGLAMAKLYRRY